MNKLKRIVCAAYDRWNRFNLDGAEYARWKGVTVGQNSQIITQNFGGEPFLISIGDDSIVANEVQFLNHDGASRLCVDEDGRRHYMRRISIGNRVFIGLRTIILAGVKIEDDVIVGAGSVVTRSVPAGWIVAGNPAKRIGYFKDYKKRALAEFVSHKQLPITNSYEDFVATACMSDSVDYLQSNHD